MVDINYCGLDDFIQNSHRDITTSRGTSSVKNIWLYLVSVTLRSVTRIFTTLQWRHNGRDDVSNNRRLDCLLNRLFRLNIEDVDFKEFQRFISYAVSENNSTAKTSHTILHTRTIALDEFHLTPFQAMQCLVKVKCCWNFAQKTLKCVHLPLILKRSLAGHHAHVGAIRIC